MTVGQCGGFVLSGGRSSRMGTDKAMLLLNGSTLLERAAEMVSSAAGSVVIVGDARRYSCFGYPVIADVFPGLGPLSGIHAALNHSQADWNLIVACDMPGLNVASLAALLDRTGRFPDADVLVPELSGQPQPLCAVYHRRALPVIHRALLDGHLKIMKALDPLRLVRLELGDEGLFRNVNTPEEWSAFDYAQS